MPDDNPQQANSDDCGPFMLLLACLLAMGEDVDRHIQLFENMAKVRQRIGTVIQHGLADPTVLTGAAANEDADAAGGLAAGRGC